MADYISREQLTWLKKDSQRVKRDSKSSSTRFQSQTLIIGLEKSKPTIDGKVTPFNARTFCRILRRGKLKVSFGSPVIFITLSLGAWR